jgi:hypothetical protein
LRRFEERYQVRFVYYSLANAPDSPWELQWIQSIRSLRRYNLSIPVYLFLYNGASAELLEEASRRSVCIHYLGDYSAYLEHLHVRGSILALFPTFHKFLSLVHSPLQNAAQIVYLDCDTFFFDDIERMMDRNASCDLCAREEPRSRRSHYGYDESHIDEALLSEIAQREGLRPILPFNSGVCILNNGIWHALESIRLLNLDLAWRLLTGCELGAKNPYSRDQKIRSSVLSELTSYDHKRAIPYPSSNAWIIEQIALWLALGRLPQFSFGLLSREDVLQGGEFRETQIPLTRSIVVHYFSNLQEEFFRIVMAVPS